MDAAARAVIADNPKLGVQVECFLYMIDVLGLTITDLLQGVNLFYEAFDSLVAKLVVLFEIFLIDINDLDSDNVARLLALAV